MRTKLKFHLSIADVAEGSDADSNVFWEVAAESFVAGKESRTCGEGIVNNQYVSIREWPGLSGYAE